MKAIVLFPLFAALCISGITDAVAGTVSINPSDEGSLYICAECNTVEDGLFLISGYIQGDVKFPTAQISGTVTQAYFTLTPAGTPVWNSTINLYGFVSGTASISAGDETNGASLGTIQLPSNFDIGQYSSFDVSAFMAGVHSPYLDFILQDSGGGADLLSPQLNVWYVSEPAPEPAAGTLLFTAVGLLVVFRPKRGSRA